MKNLLEFELHGKPVFIQIQEPESRSRGTREEESAAVQRKFTDAIAGIAPVGNALLNSLKDINTPDEINLEFGFTFTGEAGLVFTSIKSEASFKVSITWKNKKPD